MRCNWATKIFYKIQYRKLFPFIIYIRNEICSKTKPIELAFISLYRIFSTKQRTEDPFGMNFHFFFLSSSKRLDKSSKSMSSSGLVLDDVVGTSGKSDGTLGKFGKSSSVVVWFVGGAEAGGGGDILDLGCGFGFVFKFCWKDKKGISIKIHGGFRRWLPVTCYKSNVMISLRQFLLPDQLYYCWWKNKLVV